ncbi:DUF418 domain-containing protein [Croceibacterium aestuarii]|uniref:DUF418 domain-containing protein n=1 Tax=Croceibacterium aestuarii TaxID=3064139 RepID=UPI00272EB336|nr:DUF418 domain-containing protein [Croceibacterium sp. D39]
MAARRIDLVDALRGYALLGLLLVHSFERFELYWLDPRPDAWVDTILALFAGKAFAIFALLFGFSFATIMANERARGGDFTLRFAWRLVLLLAIGTVHALVYRGDILQVLALVGLVMIPFDRVTSNRWLLAGAMLAFLQVPLLVQAWAAGSGAAWATAMPFFFADPSLQRLADGSLADVIAANAGPGMHGKWSFYLATGRIMEIAGLFLVGMVLQRGGLFAAARPATWAAILAAATVLWLLVVLLTPALLPPGPGEGGAPMQQQAVVWLLDQWRALAAMAAQVAAFVLLWHTPVRRVLAPLASPGRLTLTLYVGQSLVAVPLLYGFGAGLYDDFSNAGIVLLGLAFFLLQVVAANWWLRHYRYGPLEWLWRAATRTTLDVPFRGGVIINETPTAR